MFVLILLLFTNGMLQQEADAAPLPDWSDISQGVFEGLVTLSEHGKTVSNFTASQWETLKNSTYVQNAVEVAKNHGKTVSNFTASQLETLKNSTYVQNAVDVGKSYSVEIMKAVKYYSEEIRSYLPDWAWIIIGVVLIIWFSIRIKKFCLWCCGFRKRGVAANSHASRWQSRSYGGIVESGSVFSRCQSAAMR